MASLWNIIFPGCHSRTGHEGSPWGTETLSWIAPRDNTETPKQPPAPRPSSFLLKRFCSVSLDSLRWSTEQPVWRELICWHCLCFHSGGENKPGALSLRWVPLHLAAHTFPQPAWCIPSHFSRVQLYATLQAVACLAPLSMGFPRQEYWSGLPCPSPADLPDSEIKTYVSYVPCISRQILYH